MITHLPIIAAETNPGKARQLFDLIRQSPYQKRKEIVWNAVLARVATAHCRDMVTRGYFGHTNPDGIGANERVRRGGYPLPDLYPHDLTANNIESLAAGDPSAEGTLRAWLNSPGHRPHVFGEGEFFGAQHDMGVGYYQGGYYKRYWCVVAC